MKIFLYISILAIVGGVLGIYFVASAQAPLGTCTFPLANGGTSTRQNISQAECNNLILQGGGGFGGSPGNPEGWVQTSGYKLLAPLPCDSSTPGCENGKLTTFDPAQQNNLGIYLNIMIKIIIGLAAVLSVVMIVVGGVEYMTSELSHTKEAGKEKILHAVLGLLIALGAYALLYTINPALLKSDLNVPAAQTTTPAVTPAVTPGNP